MMRKLGTLAGLVAWALLGHHSSEANAAASDAERVLGFEALTDWTITNGTLVGLSSTRTQGQSSLAVQADGYSVVSSRLLGPLGAVSPRISLDVQLPIEQPNQYWHGAIQLFVSVPTLNLYNAFVGQRDLTPYSGGTFVSLDFDLSNELREALSGSYQDLTVSVAMNVPQGVVEPYLLDNLRVSALIPPNSTIAASDIPRILGFEDENDWVIQSGTIIGNSSSSTQGNFSLALRPQGYSVITSAPMPSIAPVNETVSLNVQLPEQSNQSGWAGAIQLYVSVPSRNVSNAYLGQKELTGLSTGVFHNFEFAVPESIRAELDATLYTDLRFHIAFNVPAETDGIYFIDNLHVGAVTAPPPTPAETELRSDLVGVASSGVLTVGVAGEHASPGIVQGTFHVKSENGHCAPSASQACSFLVHQVLFEAGPFVLDGTPFTGATVSSLAPFRIILGGPHSLVAPVPSNARFQVRTRGEEPISFGVSAAAGTTFTVNPSGDGFISMTGSLSGRVDGENVSIGLVVTADTPLVNRMPVANAGPDLTVTSTTNCFAEVTLDGSGSSDPDGNLETILWTWGSVHYGRGPVITVPVRHQGPMILTATAIDAFGSESRDDTIVDVQLPSSCVIPSP